MPGSPISYYPDESFEDHFDFELCLNHDRNISLRVRGLILGIHYLRNIFSLAKAPRPGLFWVASCLMWLFSTCRTEGVDDSKNDWSSPLTQPASSAARCRVLRWQLCEPSATEERLGLISFWYPALWGFC